MVRGVQWPEGGAKLLFSLLSKTKLLNIYISIIINKKKYIIFAIGASRREGDFSSSLLLEIGPSNINNSIFILVKDSIFSLKHPHRQTTL